jgi:hypothetical protein
MKKFIIICSTIMALLFLGLFISFKMYLNKSEIQLAQTQNKMTQANRMMDSLISLEDEKQKIRIQYAENLEKDFRKINKNVIVTTYGIKDQNLKLTCLYFNETSLELDSIKNSILTWRKLGFVRVTITDGYQFSNTLKLN